MSASPYGGPLRDEPLAVELHNTIYIAAGEELDGLATTASARAWLTALGARLPVDGIAGRWPVVQELTALREHVRRALQAAAAGNDQDPKTIAAINATSARAPRAPVARWTGGGVLQPATRFMANRADVTLGVLAGETVALLTGPDRAALRVCGAPGCVLVYLKDHPRRAWCSNACGNRARQSRHYHRTRARSSN